MAGFFSNLFGRKNNDTDQPKEAFFLESDEAKSLGDLDYMRTPNVIRRTFPKSASSPEHKELIQSYTATGQNVIKAEGLQIKKDGAVLQPQQQQYNSYVVPAAAAPAPSPFAATTPAPSSFGSSAPASSFGSSTPTPPAAAPAPAPAPSEPAPRRSGDDGMDMFRNMAKNIGR
jgi:hypothetical protein